MSFEQSSFGRVEFSVGKGATRKIRWRVLNFFLVCYHLVCLFIFLVSILYNTLEKEFGEGLSGGSPSPRIFFKLRLRIGEFW